MRKSTAVGCGLDCPDYVDIFRHPVDEDTYCRPADAEMFCCLSNAETFIIGLILKYFVIGPKMEKGIPRFWS